MKYKAVIFDFDDTLVESRALKWVQHKHVGKKFYNLDFTDDDIREHYGKPFNQLLVDLYKGSDTLENIHTAIESVREDFLKRVYDGAPEVLRNLLSKNIEVGVISGTNKKFLLEDLSRLGFPHEQFFIIQGSDEVSFHRPDPGVFLPTFEKLSQKSITKEHVVYVGDLLDDLKVAHRAGIDFIAVTTGLYNEEEFKKAGAKTVLKDIKELLDFI
jgi:HAD superfamily hydrolase (TIGR01549 family)